MNIKFPFLSCALIAIPFITHAEEARIAPRQGINEEVLNIDTHASSVKAVEFMKEKAVLASALLAIEAKPAHGVEEPADKPLAADEIW